MTRTHNNCLLLASSQLLYVVFASHLKMIFLILILILLLIIILILIATTLLW
jgi:hypothetical protein